MLQRYIFSLSQTIADNKDFDDFAGLKMQIP